MADEEFTASLEQALKVLGKGGTILYPTDTVWGIGCDATNETAVQQIKLIKQRPEEKSFIVLVATEKDILKYTSAIDPLIFDYLQHTEKPTTVIYQNSTGIATGACAANGSVAIRVCKNEFCRHLIKRFGKPVVSTSANISGKAAPSTFKEIDDSIKQAVDYVVTYRQNDETPSLPSAIITTLNNKIEFLRH